MRLTTKIMLSIIAAIFLIPLIFIIGFSFTDRKNYNHSNVEFINLSQENKTGIELPSYKKILIDEAPFKSEEGYYNGFSNNCSIFLELNPEEHNSDMLFTPESLKDFIAIDTYDDTLKIIINFMGLGKKLKNDENKNRFYSELDLHFNISNIDVTSNIRRLSITAKNIHTDSIIVKSSGNIYIDSCKADVIEPVTKYRRLTIKNSDLKKLNLDLDYADIWHIENCNIEEEYLTGGKTHNITQNKDESRIIHWHPKNKNAKLNITIESDTAQIIFP